MESIHRPRVSRSFFGRLVPYLRLVCKSCRDSFGRNWLNLWDFDGVHALIFNRAHMLLALAVFIQHMCFP